MPTTQAVPQDKDTAIQDELYVSFELGDKSWKVTASDGRRGPSRYSVHSGDTAAVLDCVRRAKQRCQLVPQAKVHSCYEAGRDGWWLHRWLTTQGIDNLVIDAASIEVNRRARRAKTDRLDGDKLLTTLRRHHSGERVWSVLREPTPEQEDARRTHRELARLTHERVAHMNRIRSLLVLHNMRPQVRFGNRREVAGCLELTPTPYDSGDSQIEQGISKAGNKRARTMLVELAWRWLRLQPGSLLTQWFNHRFAGNGKRMRRVGIVALARRLAIALWRYLEHGEIPTGALLKPVAP
jgi:transposase